jgi:ABC-2 type transport system ATP-binding protein
MTDRSAPPHDRLDLVLEVREAHKAYGSRRALEGVSLVLSRGEILALLGPNGAGKTTLVRSICGRLALDSGSVRVAGEDPRSSVAARRALGLVPQEIALYSDLTGRENLEILGRLAGVERAALDHEVEAALAWTGLAERASERVGRLSGGMRRRLNLAAGTLHRPRLLLLDEPTVGIDPGAREVIHELLRGLRRRGLALLLTTHDLDQAAELADRIAILDEGKIRAEGTLQELVQAHLGGGREVWLTLAERPTDTAREMLGAAGLAEAPTDAASWSGPLEGGLEALAVLERQLDAAGLGVEELRLREAGLRGVFFRLTGREMEE